MWEPQPLTTLRASKACRGENFTLPLYTLGCRRARNKLYFHAMDTVVTGYYMCHLVEHPETLNLTHRPHLCVLYDSQNKQRLFPYTILICNGEALISLRYSKRAFNGYLDEG
jgi:hypothetical protein